MKKLLITFLGVVLSFANINAQSIVPNSGMQGQSLQTTITLTAGTMFNASAPMGFQDIYLELGATIIYANSSYSPAVSYQ